MSERPEIDMLRENARYLREQWGAALAESEGRDKINEDLWWKMQLLARMAHGILREINTIEPDLEAIARDAKKILKEGDLYGEFRGISWKHDYANDPNQLKLEVDESG